MSARSMLLLAVTLFAWCTPGCHRSVIQPAVHTADIASNRLLAGASPMGLQVPCAATSVALERHDDEPAWQGSSTTGPFLEPGTTASARPYSNLRLLWDAKYLYLSLYAADQNIEGPERRHDAPLWPHDAFAIRLRADTPDAPTFDVDISPLGAVTDVRESADGQLDAAWESGARVSIDVDGTVNDPTGEDDEEWVAFAALPWDRMGMTPLPGMRLQFKVVRCDVPKSEARRCGVWGGDVRGQPQGWLVLAAQARRITP